MKTLIFDVETVGEKLDDMDKTTYHELTRWIRETAKTEEEYNLELERIKNRMGFSPLHGEVVALGTLDESGGVGGVYFQAPEGGVEDFEQDGVKFKCMDEKTMLEKFWEVIGRYDAVAGFNSSSFDAPFLNIRSAVHGVTPSVNLMSNRYVTMQRGFKHIDLLDQLTYYGAMRAKGSMHLWTRAFGIESPKTGDLQGEDVGAHFEAGKYREIAEYNLADLYATRELFWKWKQFLDFQTR